MTNIKFQNTRGITLVITLLVMSILLAVSASLANSTLKQLQLTGVALSSEVAFQAANAGMECIFYHDFREPAVSAFAVPGDGTEQSSTPMLDCMGLSSVAPLFPLDGRAVSGEEQRYQFSWGAVGQNLCTDVSVYKFYSTSGNVPVVIDGVSYRADDCPQGSVCTVVQSRGYNTSCATISTASRVVEREYSQVY